MSGFVQPDSLLLVRLSICPEKFSAIEFFWNLLRGAQDRGFPVDKFDCSLTANKLVFLLNVRML